MTGKGLYRIAAHCSTGALLCAAAVGTLGTVEASAEEAANGVAAIELRRLLEPTSGELAQERKGRIYIYDGLRGADIEQAMDIAFDRIEHMMFIRVQKTDDEGKVMRDPATGSALIEDDGC